MPMEIAEVVKTLAAGGFATLLIAILVAGRYRQWLWYNVYDEMVAAKDKAYSEMVAAKDAAYAAMVKEKDRQIDDERREKIEWKDYLARTRDFADRSIAALSKVVGE